MGTTLSSIYNYVSSTSTSTTKPLIIVTGLDAAGKTTIVDRYLGGGGRAAGPHQYQSSICQNREHNTNYGSSSNTSRSFYKVADTSFSPFEFELFDIGNCARLHFLISPRFHLADAIVFVVDANDTNRLSEAASFLHEVVHDAAYLLQDSKNANCPVLIFLNKVDLPGALSEEDMREGLRLDELEKKCSCVKEEDGQEKIRSFKVQIASAVKNYGVTEGMNWLRKQLL